MLRVFGLPLLGDAWLNRVELVVCTFRVLPCQLWIYLINLMAKNATHCALQFQGDPPLLLGLRFAKLPFSELELYTFA